MKIITGRAKTGKSTYIYDGIKSQLDKQTSDNLILIVPDLMTYQTEYNIIKHLSIDGIMKVEVLSFKRLASKILEEIGGADAEDLSVYGKVMLLKQIFEEHSKDLKLFKKSSSHEGFLKEFNLLIQELKQNQVDLDALVEVSNQADNYLIKSKLEDIKLIYSQYIERTMDKYFDEEDKYELVISMIKDSNYIKKSRIWIDGFESFNYQRIKMIKNLAENSKSVTLSLNIDSSYLSDLESFDDWEAFKTIYDSYELLREEIADLEIVSLNKSKIPSPEIALIEKNLFSLKPQIFKDKTDNIKVYSSINPYTETEKTAIKIVSLVRDQGYRWKDIKVAVGNMDNYEKNIKKLFNKYEIPYFLDTKRDIMNNHVTNYILSLLDIFIWNFKYDHVFEFLKTGLSSLDDYKVQSLENYALEHGIEGGKWFEEMKSSDIEEIRKIFASDFEGARREFRSLSTSGQITNFIFKFLRKDKVKKKLEEDIERFKEDEDFERSSELSQVWNKIMEVFEQIVLVSGDMDISPLDYRRILESGFKEVEISVIPPTIDTVEVGDISRIGINSSKALFIMGANEGNFESTSDKGLLLDDDRKGLLDKGIKLVKGENFAFFKDRHMLYKAFTSPVEKLFLSYALGTVDGKSLQASLYISTIKEIFPLIEEETDITGNDQMDFISNHSGSYDFLVENIRRYLDGIAIDDVWKAVYSWYRNHDSGESFSQITEAFNFQNISQRVNSHIIRSIYGKEMKTSVSRLETYAECNFKYFADSVLKVKPRKNQKIEAYDIGNIYHDSLENFINKLIDMEDLASLSDESIDQMINDIIDDTLEEYAKKVSALDANKRNEYSKTKIRRVLNRAGLTLVKQLQNSEFKPKYTELHIGLIDEEKEKGKLHLDHVEIKIDQTTVRLRGKIDRVDSYEDEDGNLYVVIIDYKSSDKAIDFVEVSEGLQIQLFVYLNAIIEKGESLFNKKPKVAGVFYYTVDDPIIKDKYDNLEEEIFKSLKLSGYLLDDIDLAKKMDINIDNGITSQILPTAITQKGLFSGTYKNQLSEDEFEKILAFVKDKCREMSTGILNGEFAINPYRRIGGKTPCTYCDYKGICKFDKELANDYRRISLIGRDAKDKAKTIIVEKGGSLKDAMDR